MERHDDLREQELQTYRGLVQAYQDILEGKVVDAKEADAAIREAKGWS